MNSATAGLVGAIIGASAGLLGSLGTSYFQGQLEERKAVLSQAGNASSELRAEIRATAQHMLSLQHSMEWVCWLAKQDQSLPDDEAVSRYHSEVHESIPKLLGAMANVASFDNEIYGELQPLADELFELDGQIAAALVRHAESPPKRAEALRGNYKEATLLYRTLPRRLAEIQKRTFMGNPTGP